MNLAGDTAAEFEIGSVMGGSAREMRRPSNVVAGGNVERGKGNRHCWPLEKLRIDM